MEISKPFLACDVDLTKLKYPTLVLPKLDGVRGMNLKGGLVGRSLKPHGNLHTTKFFSVDPCIGFDGELCVNNDITSSSLCRDTTSALNTHEGQPDIHWQLFDYITPENAELPYIDRLVELAYKWEDLQKYNEGKKLHLVPHYIVDNEEQLLNLYNQWINEGYEGLIVRDPYAPHKNGRSTANQQGYLRLKPTGDTEANVVSIIEGETNNNPATINELGHTERSTHKANMVPNGMVGALMVKGIRIMNGKPEPVECEFKISAGCMSHKDRLHYFQNPDQLIGQTVKYKFFDHGAKDELRMARFHSIRAKSDIGEE